MSTGGGSSWRKANAAALSAGFSLSNLFKIATALSRSPRTPCSARAFTFKYLRMRFLCAIPLSQNNNKFAPCQMANPFGITEIAGD